MLLKEIPLDPRSPAVAEPEALLCQTPIFMEICKVTTRPNHSGGHQSYGFACEQYKSCSVFVTGARQGNAAHKINV